MLLKNVLSAGCAAVAMMTCPAFAQSSASGGAAAADQTGDIIVTATRREERLQDVPMSVTALSTDSLAQKQVVDVLSLAKVVPGMQAKPTLNEANMTLAIRGVTQLNATPTMDPPIGIYVDGVYNVMTAGSNTAMIDMERVEVLKGPQGTLFGRNTIGGALNITTKKPTNTFEGYVQADVGNYGTWGLSGVVNAPIVEDLIAARIAYQHAERNGYGHNLTTGNPTGSLNQDYVRGTISFSPPGGWNVLLSGFYNSSHGFSAASRLGYMGSPFNASFPAASGKPGDLLSNYVDVGGFQDAAGNVDGRYALKQYGVSATLTGDLSDAVTIKSITAYLNTDLAQSNDFDGTPYPVLDVYSNKVRGDQWTQELQLYGNALEGRLSWITGGYFFAFTGSQLARSGQLVNLAPAAARTLNNVGPVADNQSYSAFAQLTYEILPDVRLTGGIRYVVDERKAAFRDFRSNLATGAFVTCQLANAANPVTGALGTTPVGCYYATSDKFKYAPWTVGIDVKPNSDTLLYSKLSKGYRSGALPPTAGPTATAPSAAVSGPAAVAANTLTLAAFGAVPPENLLSAEAGAKLQFLDRRLTVNAAGYYSWYKNVQLTVNSIPCAGCANTTIVVNSGDAKIWGGELEVRALLGGLTLDVNLGYTHPRYDRGSLNFGLPIINVSKFNGAVSANYPLDLNIGTLSLGATYSYRSKAVFFTSPAGATQAQVDAITQPGFGLLDSRLSFSPKNLPLTATVFVSNLTDKKYRVSGSSYPAPFAFAQYFAGAPRTYGATLRFDF